MASVATVPGLPKRWSCWRWGAAEQRTSRVLKRWSVGCTHLALQGGKSNWVADKLEPVPEIYEAMASSMRGSWNQVRSEVRMIDMPITSKEQLEQYLRRRTCFVWDEIRQPSSHAGKLWGAAVSVRDRMQVQWGRWLASKRMALQSTPDICIFGGAQRSKTHSCRGIMRNLQVLTCCDLCPHAPGRCVWDFAVLHTLLATCWTTSAELPNTTHCARIARHLPQTSSHSWCTAARAGHGVPLFGSDSGIDVV